jgi:SAM-dependent methyltransferase
MTARDRVRWDERYAARAAVDVAAVSAPDEFAAHESAFPYTGRALDLACGQGRTAVWLARRGMDVLGVDVSAVAIDRACDLALRCGVERRTRFEVTDLDDGLPPGPPADVIVCHRFRDRRLDRPILARLVPGGLLAVTALSEVGASPGPFRAVRGELTEAFGGLDILVAGEADGHAWLLGRHTSPP